MRDWLTRIAVAVLSMGLTLAAVVACCGALEDLKTETHNCHSSPCPSHACCAHTIEVQATAPQLSTTSDRTNVHASVDVNVPLSSRSSPSLLRADSAARNRGLAVPGSSEDLLARIHILLI